MKPYPLDKTYPKRNLTPLLTHGGPWYGKALLKKELMIILENHQQTPTEIATCIIDDNERFLQ